MINSDWQKVCFSILFCSLNRINFFFFWSYKLTTVPPSLCLPPFPDRPIIRRVTLLVYLLPGTWVYKTQDQDQDMKKGPYLVVCSQFFFSNPILLVLYIFLTVDFRIIEERRESPIFESDRPTASGEFEATPKSTTSRTDHEGQNDLAMRGYDSGSLREERSMYIFFLFSFSFVPLACLFY